MKVLEITGGRPLLLDLIAQRLKKHEAVYLDFEHSLHGGDITGWVNDIIGLKARLGTTDGNWHEYTFGANADELYDIVRSGPRTWRVVNAGKLTEGEEQVPLLLDLIVQRIKKGDEVFMDLDVSSVRSTFPKLYGKIFIVHGNTAAYYGHGVHDHFVFGPDADELYDLIRTGSKSWKVVNRKDPNEAA